MIDHSTLVRPDSCFDETPGLGYVAEVAGGNYHVWVRCWVPSVWGSLGRGGDLSGSACVGVDGVLVGQILEGGERDDWEWACVAQVSLMPGEDTLQLRVREGGVALDAIYLTLEAGELAELNLTR